MGAQVPRAEQGALIPAADVFLGAYAPAVFCGPPAWPAEALVRAGPAFAYEALPCRIVGLVEGAFIGEKEIPVFKERRKIGWAEAEHAAYGFIYRVELNAGFSEGLGQPYNVLIVHSAPYAAQLGKARQGLW
jgi:hypothetical protein